ncbi:MAG TPA: carboxypeptidase-like regulatory domain-containing protein, partial [Pyrinomonadaceae bacterium]|nr:carboxypeptidase-like regulatory domain-containing protein [Pyrinomonadaceae bacterium]
MRWCLLRAPIPFVLSIGLLFAVALKTSAQSTASIEGQVTDQQGAVIPGVRLVARSAAIGVERTATSDNSGRYQFPALPIGDYTIRAIATGFKQQVVERTIEVGTRITQDFNLQVGDVAEQVAISSTSD